MKKLILALTLTMVSTGAMASMEKLGPKKRAICKRTANSGRIMPVSTREVEEETGPIGNETATR